MTWIGNVFKENKMFYRFKKKKKNILNFQVHVEGQGLDQMQRDTTTIKCPFVWNGGSLSQCSVHKLPSCPSPWEIKAANTVVYSMHGYF